MGTTSPRSLEHLDTILPLRVSTDCASSASTDSYSASLPSSPAKAGLARSASSVSSRIHTRYDSAIDAPRKVNRLSITLPIQAAPSPALTSPSPTRPNHSTTPLHADILPPAGPSDVNFLTALAAQERKILDLKEELIRAQDALYGLKMEWAAHEAQKKRREARKVQRMRALHNANPSAGSQREERSLEAGLASRQDHERIQNALNANTRPAKGTVSSGSRHVRTLSLLSPNNKPQDVPLRSLHSEPNTAHPDGEIVEATDDNDTTLTDVSDSRRLDDKTELGLPSEVLIRTGRQMASDIKDGLLTFIDDLRQVTVGDEGLNSVYIDSHGRSRSLYDDERSLWPTNPTKNHIHREPKKPLIDVGESFWSDNGVTAAVQSSKPKCHRHSNRNSVSHTRQPASIDHMDAWDTWDSPNAKKTADESPKNASSGQLPRREASDSEATYVSRAT